MTSRLKSDDGTGYRTVDPGQVKARNPATGVYVPVGWMLKARNPSTGVYERVLVDPGVPNPLGLFALAAITVDEDGVTRHGVSADTFHDPASMVKTMTVYTARQLLGSDLTSTTTIVADDIITNPAIDGTVAVDDVVAVGELMYGSMLPSSNNCARALARTVGTALPGGGTGREKFIAEMNSRTVSDFGWSGASFLNEFSFGQVTPRQLADLLWTVNDDPFMVAAMGLLTHEFVVAGGPDPRTTTINHTINPDGATSLPGYVGGKTGTSGGASVMALWDAGGRRYASVVLQSTVAERFPDLRRLIDAEA